MAKSLMICSNAINALKLYESENLPSKYILEGIFAELDKLNRNQRIYQKEEYLKHLQYLRNDIKKGEPLLGELDHPDDRFEVKLKEASHRVIDLWYDSAKNVVMGKIELLNTPNGKLAQSIVDQGIPLHISSRAAGTVNGDNTVSIQQIYTYDLVCKPGFAGAVLYRVNESASGDNYTAEVRSFLSNSLKTESLNSAPQYGIVNENVSVSEITAPANLRKEAKEIQINKQIEISEDMTKPILENDNPDSTVGKPLTIGNNGGAAALGIPTANMGGTSEAEDSSTSEKKEDKEKDDKDKDSKPATDVSDNASDNSADTDKSENEDKKEDCPKCGKNPCECEDKDDKKDDDKKEDKDDKKTNEEEEESSDDKDSDNKEEDDKSDDDKDSNSDDGEKSDDSDEDTGVEILDVEAEFEDEAAGEDMIMDVNAEYEDDDKSDDDKSDDSDEDGDKEESDDKKEDDASEAKDEDKPSKEDEKKAKEAQKMNDDACKDIEKHKDSVFKKLDDLKAAIEKKSSEKKESKNESIIMAKYPVSMMMTESNFAEFVSLNESQKTKVVAYLQDNNFTNAKAINENWKNGVNYVADVPVWLKYAPDMYKNLYESSSDDVKRSIATTAKYVLFENQYDINNFWENSGLAEVNEQKLLNESFINNLPKVQTVNENANDLPYGNDFIQQIADMASEYNNRRY